jgi:hypothetical protein
MIFGSSKIVKKNRQKFIGAKFSGIKIFGFFSRVIERCQALLEIMSKKCPDENILF